MIKKKTLNPVIAVIVRAHARESAVSVLVTTSEAGSFPHVVSPTMLKGLMIDHSRLSPT